MVFCWLNFAGSGSKGPQDAKDESSHSGGFLNETKQRGMENIFFWQD